MRHFGFIRPLGVTLAVGAMVMAAALPAAAGDGNVGDDDPPPNGYTAEVDTEIVLDGNTIPGSNGRVQVSVPARCWWDHFSADPELFKDFMNGVSSLPIFGFLWQLLMKPDDKFLDKAVEIWDDGKTPVNWYVIDCVEGATPEERSSHLTTCTILFPDDCFGSPFAYFVENEEPPVVVEPEQLALEAREHLEIPEPEVDRNPKSAELDQATLVNVPTWFWVTDPDAVGGEDGTLSVRASIPETGIWAEVTATTGGLALASAAGNAQCEPQRALQQWAAGADDANGCTVAFDRASVNHPGGYPVTAETQWTASWVGEGVDGAESGDLPPATAQETVNVPVAEVQGVARE